MSVLGAAATYAITDVIVTSRIARPLRLRAARLGETIEYMANCAQCVGVWTGLAVGMLSPEPGRSRLLSGLANVGLALVARELIDAVSNTKALAGIEHHSLHTFADLERAI